MAQLNTPTSRASVVSLFAGCGGLDLGFTGDFKSLGKRYPRLPFDIAWANELNPAAVATYRRNFAHDIACGDIWDQMADLPERCDVLIGGFPCQDISVNGKRRGLEEGTRSGLYRAMVAAVAQTRPKVFVAENVKGLLMSYNREALATVLEEFAELGYEVSYQLYLAADYGVSQTRERVFIVGTAPGVASFQPPAPVLSKPDWIGVEEAIGDLAALPEDPAWSHIWSRANRSPDQGDRRLRADRPGYTIRAECHGNIQWHYSLPRRISMREAARIQSFPDDFIFDAKLRQTERMIGNAVPPVLGWHIANAVAECLGSERDESVSDPGTSLPTASSRQPHDQLSLATL